MRRGSLAHALGQRVAVVLRPEDITVQILGAMAGSLSGKVAEIGYQGDSCRLSVAVGGEAIKVKVPPHRALALQPGSAVELSWERSAARLLSLDDRETA
jgi:ABC-type Fe3+/spermidine/putrescine transport system ATPase subunit